VIKIDTSRDKHHDPGEKHSALSLNVNQSLFRYDSAFDWLYPDHIEAKSRRYWTPLAVAKRAAGFLAEPGARVLDIGSGIGKFCLAGAYHYPETFFYGVEQRHELVLHAEEAKTRVQLPNAHFIYANMTQINFREFDHFYFYNSFYENVDPEDPIDDAIATSYSLYNYYNRYLLIELDKKPAGTRLVSFHSTGEEVPPSYSLADMDYDTLLKMWIKK
jgi:ubiquinone/menaquinone biosynthesis C-methylase UbiE